MRHLTCDVAVIGAGTAGLAARRAAVAAGAKTLLIEAGPGGTTCARFGCMPSKLLLAAANAARDAALARHLGVGRAGRIKVDGAAVMARVQRKRDRFVQGVLDDVAAIPAKDKLHGRARFDGPTTLVVGEDTHVDARAVVIAVGARPATPSALHEACGERLLTHETVFELPRLPRSLAVIGAGPLGLELALAFSRLGVRTVVFDEAETIGGVDDPQVRTAAQATLGKELNLELGVKVTASRRDDGQVTVSWRRGHDRARRGIFEYVLSAAGRPPALKGLDLDKTGLKLDKHGVPAFDLATLRCGQSAIFIAGDANNARPILHEAAAQGERAGANATRLPHLERGPPGVSLSVVFSSPDIALVGEVFDPEAAKGWAIGASDDNGRARVEGKASGLLRVYVRRKDQVVLGGALFGAQAEHLGQMLAWLAQRELTVDEALALPFYHPTVEEGLRAALRGAKAQL